MSRLIIESIRTQLLMDSRAASPWSGLRRTGGGVGLGVGSRVLTSWARATLHSCQKCPGCIFSADLGLFPYSGPSSFVKQPRPSGIFLRLHDP